MKALPDHIQQSVGILTIECRFTATTLHIGIPSLVGQPLFSKRKGLVYCFRTSCTSGMRKYVNQCNRSHAPHGNNVCPAGQQSTHIDNSQELSVDLTIQLLRKRANYRLFMRMLMVWTWSVDSGQCVWASCRPILSYDRHLLSIVKHPGRGVGHFL